jgi:predicted homoserine dehydrogenase-like protein
MGILDKAKEMAAKAKEATSELTDSAVSATKGAYEASTKKATELKDQAATLTEEATTKMKTMVHSDSELVVTNSTTGVVLVESTKMEDINEFLKQYNIKLEVKK